ncbi:MAG: hypothetical protein ACU843_02675 [Gammaproteobacteria bacterium]
MSFVALFPKLIHEIFLASLAGLMVCTGYRLASLPEFAETLNIRGQIAHANTSGRT